MAAVRQVVAFGNVQISTQAIETLTAHEIPIVYMTGYCRFVASVQPAPLKNVGLRVAQYKRFADPVESLTLAKSIVRAKLANQRTLLMCSLRDDDARGSDEPAARDLAELLRRLDHATEVESVLGFDGQGAALYFGEFARFLTSAPLPPHEQLAHLLEERQMSQADLVRATDIAKATVSDLVSGKRSFTVEQTHIVGTVFALPGAVFMARATRN